MKTETKEAIHGHLFKKKKKALNALGSRWKRRKNLCPRNTDLSKQRVKAEQDREGWYIDWYWYDIDFLSLQKVKISQNDKVKTEKITKTFSSMFKLYPEIVSRFLIQIGVFGNINYL